MIKDVHELRSILVRDGIAAESDIAGCSAAELDDLERRHGSLPASYRQIMGLIGHGAGQLVDSGEFWIYADQIGRIRDKVHAHLAEIRAAGEEVPDIPPIAFVISARYGEYPHYLLTGDAPDSIVYVFDDDDETVRKAFDSVWDWIEVFVKDTQFFLERGFLRSNPRRGEGGVRP